MAVGLPMGKRIVGVRPVFSALHRILPRRPLSPVCALGTSPKRGSALRGEGFCIAKKSAQPAYPYLRHSEEGEARRGNPFLLYAAVGIRTVPRGCGLPRRSFLAPRNDSLVESLAPFSSPALRSPLRGAGAERLRGQVHKSPLLRKVLFNRTQTIPHPRPIVKR